ncbi:MAG: hypothetical protein HY466_03680 [Deltaproteobacteria bacterium]|nr:hypothetical protein [Deltaproteobacteria bacterium]
MPDTTSDPSPLPDDAFLAAQAEKLAVLQGALNVGGMNTYRLAEQASPDQLAVLRGALAKKAGQGNESASAAWTWIRGDWPQEVFFKEVLEDLLDRRHSFYPSLDLAWEALESQKNKSPAARIVALMVLGDAIPDLIGTKSLRRAANILQPILDDPKAHPRLRELALAVMEAQHFHLSGANPTILDKLPRWQAEIRMGTNLLPFWWNVFPEILELRQHGLELLKQVRTVFAQSDGGYPEWRKVLAMKCYCRFIFFPDGIVLSGEEADLAAAPLLRILHYQGKEGRLGRVAALLFAYVVNNQIRRIGLEHSDPDTIPAEDKKWVRGRVRQLRIYLGEQDPLVVWLEPRMFGILGPDEGNGSETPPVLAIPSPAVAPGPSPSWWRRFRTGRLGLRRRLK